MFLQKKMSIEIFGCAEMDLEAVSEVDTSVTSDFAEAATNNLLPEKSRNLYEKEYTEFCK